MRNKQKRKEKPNYFIKSLKYLKPYKRYAFFTILSCILAAATSVLFPIFTERTLTAFTNGDGQALIISAALLLLFQLIHSGIHMLLWGGTNANKLRSKVTKDIRYNLMESVFQLKNRNFDLNGSGKLLQVVNGDTSSLANVYNNLVDVFMSMISKVAIFVYIFAANYILGFYCLFEFVIVCYAYHFRIKERMKDQRKLKKINDKNLGLVVETIRGVRDIKNYNIQGSMMEKVDESLKELEVSDNKFASKQYQLFRITVITKNIMKFLFIPLALLLIHYNLTTFAVAFTIFVFRNDAVAIIDWIMNTWEYIKDGDLYAERIFHVMKGWEEGFEEFPEKDKFDKLPKQLNIKIENLDFSYNGKDKILKNFNLEIPHGRKVALVGASGTGKSTALKLLNKSYDIEKGKIFIGGQDVCDFSMKTLRNCITIVPQDPYIFNFSIYENLKLFNPKATKRQIENACKKAQIYDFIKSLPEGFDTILGEAGTRLSGGQKQRLAIARAFLKDSPILIFDETTSALDNENQRKIKEVIDNIGRDKIVIVVAHRLSTIVDSDEIHLIKNGAIKTSGTHQELLKNSKEYRRLYERESLAQEIDDE